MRFNSPLRYPGGKGKLAGYITQVYFDNGLKGGHYVEPYAGGAGVALNLLMNDVVSHIHLNDLNYAIFCFWNSVLESTAQLCELIDTTEVTIDEWYRQKSIIEKPFENSKLAIGFATFFLNRTNRSGILLGGVIGGKAQEGKWKLDARFNKIDLINRINRIASRKDDITLHNLDSYELIKNIVPTLPDCTLIYLDPPYYVKGKGLYQNHYKHEDHENIAKLVSSEIKQPWIVSYDNVPEISAMYEGYKKIEYGINYSAQERYKGAEVMFFSHNVTIPKKIINPLKFK